MRFVPRRMPAFMKPSPIIKKVRKKAANIAKHGRPRKHRRIRSKVREASSKAVSARLAENND